MASGRAMSLRGLLAWQAGMLGGGTLVLAGVGFWALRASRADFGVAVEGYRELARAYEVGSEVRAGRVEEALRRVERMELGGVDAVAWQRVLVGVRRAVARPGPEAMAACVAELAALSEGVQGWIAASELRAAVRERWVEGGLGVGALVLAVGCGAVGVVQYRKIARPVGRLRQAAGALGKRELSARVSEVGPAELRGLAGDFNRMAGELEAIYLDLEGQVEARTAQVVTSARLASVGYLAAGVAHEVNNPLGIITGYAERALRGDGLSGQVREALEVACEEAYRCKAITGKLLSLARVEGDGLAVEAVDLGALAEGVAERVRALPIAAGRNVVVEGGDVMAAGREAELRQVVMNLVTNALEATGVGGRVVVRVLKREVGAVVEVEDDGAGMSGEVLARAFEPFFTTRRGGESAGVGLGLAIVQTLVEGHGGVVRARSEGVGRGSVVTVRLPGLGDGVR